MKKLASWLLLALCSVVAGGRCGQRGYAIICTCTSGTDCREKCGQREGCIYTGKCEPNLLGSRYSCPTVESEQECNSYHECKWDETTDAPTPVPPPGTCVNQRLSPDCRPADIDDNCSGYYRCSPGLFNTGGSSIRICDSNSRDCGAIDTEGRCSDYRDCTWEPEEPNPSTIGNMSPSSMAVPSRKYASCLSVGAFLVASIVFVV